MKCFVKAAFVTLLALAACHTKRHVQQETRTDMLWQLDIQDTFKILPGDITAAELPPNIFTAVKETAAQQQTNRNQPYTIIRHTTASTNGSTQTETTKTKDTRSKPEIVDTSDPATWAVMIIVITVIGLLVLFKVSSKFARP